MKYKSYFVLFLLFFFVFFSFNSNFFYIILAEFFYAPKITINCDICVNNLIKKFDKNQFFFLSDLFLADLSKYFS